MSSLLRGFSSKQIIRANLSPKMGTLIAKVLFLVFFWDVNVPKICDRDTLYLVI